MNTIAPSKNAYKGLGAVDPMTPRAFNRQKSDISNNCLKEIPESVPYSKSPRHPAHLEHSSKSKIYDKIHVLDQMGFGSLLKPNFEANIDTRAPLKRRYSIGISDFWTGIHKQKFIRENGYKEALNTLKKDVLISDLVKNSSLRKPTLPYIMDSNTKRRNLICSDNITGTPKAKEQHRPILNETYKNILTDTLNSVVEKCNLLANENKKFKIQTERLRSDSSKKVKVSRLDKEKIYSIVQSMV